MRESHYFDVPERGYAQLLENLAADSSDSHQEQLFILQRVCELSSEESFHGDCFLTLYLPLTRIN